MIQSVWKNLTGLQKAAELEPLQARRNPKFHSGWFRDVFLFYKSGSASFYWPKYAQIVDMLFPPSSVRLEYSSSGLKVCLAHALVQR